MLKILGLVMGLSPPPQALAAEPQALAAVQQAWAEVKYDRGVDPQRLAAAEAVERQAAALAAREPGPESRLWLANALCLTAEVLHSARSLAKVRAARDVLLSAEREAPERADVLALLGSIYYEMPGWPIGFGDRKTAEGYLRRALVLDPAGRDANFFMGDYLLQAGRAAEAVPYLERGLAAAGDATLADRGRRGEIAEALAKARAKVR
jgi:predicted Zn-dependent protease